MTTETANKASIYRVVLQRKIELDSSRAIARTSKQGTSLLVSAPCPVQTFEMAPSTVHFRSYQDSSGLDRHNEMQWVFSLHGEMEFEVSGHGGRLSGVQGVFVASGEKHDQFVREPNRFLVLHGFTPFQLALGRYLAYGAISLVVLLPRIRLLCRQLAGRDWMSLVWPSLVGNLLYYAFVAFAVQSAGGAATSLVVGLVPVVIALAAASEPGTVPVRRLAPALLLSVLGVCLIGWQALSVETMSAPWTTRCLGLLCAGGALSKAPQLTPSGMHVVGKMYGQTPNARTPDASM